MTHDTVPDTDTQTVTDLDAEKAILVARIHWWANDRGFKTFAETVLKEIGLAHLLPGGPRPYSLDLSPLRDAIPAEIDLVLRDNQTDAYTLASRVDDAVARYLDAFKMKLYHLDITATEVQPQTGVIDVAAVLEQWGAVSSPYPRAGTDEIEQFRHHTAKTVMRLGESQRWCDVLEDGFREIGLESYLPPREKTMTIAIPDDLRSIAVTLPLNRVGEIDQRGVTHALSRELARQLADRDDLMPPELVPRPGRLVWEPPLGVAG